MSSIPKVEAAWGYGGTGYHNSQCHAAPQWGPNMARLPERPAEVVLQSEPELIIRLLEHSLKSLHYLFVLFFRIFSGHLAEETATFTSWVSEHLSGGASSRDVPANYLASL